MNIALLILIGFVVGLYIMAMGGSGAAVYLGILTVVVGLEGSQAISTTLAVSFPALAIGAYSFYRKGKIDFKLGRLMLFAALPTVVIGSLVSPYIPNDIYSLIIGLILILLGIQIFRQKEPTSSTKMSGKHRLLPFFYACIGGLMVGISGLSGGGPIFAGLLIMGLDSVRAAATSSFIMLGMIFTGILFHSTGGIDIDWVSGSGIMIGSVIGAFLSPIMLSRLNAEKMTKIVKPVLASLLVMMGLFNIFG